jgi:hypothetical protein
MSSFYFLVFFSYFIQVNNSEPQHVTTADDGVQLLSAQVQEPEKERDGFKSYDSPFALYPLLRSRSHPVFSGDPARQVSSSSGSSAYIGSSSSFIPSSLPSASSISSQFSIVSHVLPDLRPLKFASTIRLLDPYKRVCQYEVPGGGVCRDTECDDVHLSRIGAEGEPSGASRNFLSAG